MNVNYWAEVIRVSFKLCVLSIFLGSQFVNKNSFILHKHDCMQQTTK